MTLYSLIPRLERSLTSNIIWNFRQLNLNSFISTSQILSEALTIVSIWNIILRVSLSEISHWLRLLHSSVRCYLSLLILNENLSNEFVFLLLLLIIGELRLNLLVLIDNSPWSLRLKVIG